MLNKNTVLLLFAAFVLSFAPLFAKFIHLEAGILTWWRVLFALLILGLILSARKQIRIPATFLKWTALSGALLGLHWWAFFMSIQASSVSIGVLTLFTYPLISALLEPISRRVAFSLRQIMGGIGIVVGVYFLVPDFSLSNAITRGVLIGLGSAFFYATRNIVTKKYLSETGTMTTLFYQLLFALIALTIVIFLAGGTFVLPARNDFLNLLLLSLLFTVGGHGLMTHCFKLFSASTVGIVGSLQIVFSTLLAMLLLSEIPDQRFFLGAVTITSIAIYELLPHKNRRTRNKLL